MSFPITKKVREKLISDGYFVVTEVNFEVVKSLISWILNNRPDKKEFTIVINSPGGDPAAVVYLASFFRFLKKEVKLHGIAFGECGSAALAMLQLCHKRSAALNTGFFIHHLQRTIKMSCQETDLSVVKKKLADAKQTEHELVKIQRARTGLSAKKWERLADRGEEFSGRAIMAKEAKELGLIDAVLRQFDLF